MRCINGQKKSQGLSDLALERETGFEPATSTLARLHSTTELFPRRTGLLATGEASMQQKRFFFLLLVNHSTHQSPSSTVEETTPPELASG